MLNYLLSKRRMKRMLSVFIIVSMLFTLHASFVFAEGTVGASLRALDEDDEEVSMDSHDFDMKI